MLVFFDDDYYENLYEGRTVPGKPRFDNTVVKQFVTKVNILKNASNSHTLRNFRSLKFEKLEGHDNLYSIRVNLQYRIEFRLQNDQVTFTEVVFIETLSNHYH
jgi:plasmid maintenance system killer protein